MQTWPNGAGTARRTSDMETALRLNSPQVSVPDAAVAVGIAARSVTVGSGMLMPEPLSDREYAAIIGVAESANRIRYMGQVL